jgi:hypothetical protein
MSIPLSLFEGKTITGISWHPACGNDDLTISTSLVPEPATVTLAAVGLVPLAWRRCRSP